jgi:hypothetical protein
MDTAERDNVHPRPQDPPAQPQAAAANDLVPTEIAESREKSRCWIESARWILAHLILTRLVQAAA